MQQSTKGKSGCVLLCAIGFVVLIALAIFNSVADTIGIDRSTFIFIVVIAIGCAFGLSSMHKAKKIKEYQEQRRQYLIQKYGPETAQLLLNQNIWHGATCEMMLDAFGQPADIDTAVMRNKHTSVLKYYPKGYNRYGMRITVENGYVIGWELK